MEGFKTTNECVDDLSKINVPKITNDLQNAVSTLDVLHYTIWACAIFTIFEFVWLIPCGETVRQSRKKANKRSKKQAEKKAEKHEKFENEP